MGRTPWQRSANDLAHAIRTKQISSQEVVRAHLDRIAAVNPTINAITVVLEDQALQRADEADRAIASGAAVGPLHGVPVTLKENFDLDGTPTTFGVEAYRDALAESDTPVVAHLKRAGAIPIARTNLPDFGLRWHTDSGLHGATLNPWDPARTPGGSSGGEAAAIATGMSPLGLGNDMGGSLRYPAACCGIAALRPSLGRVSRRFTSLFAAPPLLYEQVAAVNGPMARTVADLRLALDVIGQADPGDPDWTPVPDVGFDRSAPRRVAVSYDLCGEALDPPIAAALRVASDCLVQAGYEVEEVAPPALEDAGRCLQVISDVEMTSYLDDLLAMISPEAGDYVRTLLAVGDSEITLDAYRAAIAERYRIAGDWSLFMARYPLVLGPVSSRVPFEVGHDLTGRDALDGIVRSLRLTEACNLLGLPSLALPVTVADGLPRGVQVIAWRFNEPHCFEAAEAIERSVGVFTPIEPSAMAAGG